MSERLSKKKKKNFLLNVLPFEPFPTHIPKKVYKYIHSSIIYNMTIFFFFYTSLTSSFIFL